MTDESEETQMLSDCIQRESKLSDWEREFVDSLSHQRGKGRSLTAKQIAVLSEIWERVTA